MLHNEAADSWSPAVIQVVWEQDSSETTFTGSCTQSWMFLALHGLLSTSLQPYLILLLQMRND